MSLAEMKCVPCRGGTPPMEESRARELVKELLRGRCVLEWPCPLTPFLKPRSEMDRVRHT